MYCVVFDVAKQLQQEKFAIGFPGRKSSHISPQPIQQNLHILYGIVVNYCFAVSAEIHHFVKFTVFRHNKSLNYILPLSYVVSAMSINNFTTILLNIPEKKEMFLGHLAN